MTNINFGLNELIAIITLVFCLLVDYEVPSAKSIRRESMLSTQA